MIQKNFTFGIQSICPTEVPLSNSYNENTTVSKLGVSDLYRKGASDFTTRDEQGQKTLANSRS